MKLLLIFLQLFIVINCATIPTTFFKPQRTGGNVDTVNTQNAAAPTRFPTYSFTPDQEVRTSLAAGARSDNDINSQSVVYGFYALGGLLVLMGGAFLYKAVKKQ